jgi:pimeloyl-ACP methyl ester carboxylesterase
MTKLLPALLLPLLALTVRADAPADVLAKAPSRFASSDGARVHYKSLGDGKTALVLVHGWSCDHTFWRDQAAAFAGKVRVIALDLPGHGQSDRPEVVYSIDRFARAVDAVLADAGVESAVLAGHSMGTPVVRQFYRLHPKKVQGLVVVDGALRSFFTDLEQADKFVSRFAGPDFKEKVGEFVDGMFKPDTPAELRERVKTRMQAATPHVAASAMKGMADPAIWKDDKIEVPVLAILARAPHWTPEYKEYVQKLAPDLDYREMEGVGHFLHMEKPGEVNALLAGFLKKVGVLTP